ncbi:MAG: amidinotransferase [Bacteroidetes bacterium]|nr:amidinotransferase [Bacteroidota bacterium]
MLPKKVLMCKPEYFDINYIGNEYMTNLNADFDKDLALKQWNDLKSTYENLGFEVNEINPVKELVDMVFTANQSLPFTDSHGNKKVVLSKMRNSQREDEVKHFEDFYLKDGYEIIKLPEEISYFESMGDAIIDYKRKIIFGGYGYRTHENVYDFLKEVTNYEIVKVRLMNKYFYHLDTCFSLLNSHTAMICRDAFSEDDFKKLTNYFTDIIEVDADENKSSFACNCHCPDGQNVIIDKRAEFTKNILQKNEFNVTTVDTSEFMKSGGSVFCMKMMYF